MKVRFMRLTPDAVVPRKAHSTDAGFDIVATSRKFDELGNIVYGTGIAVEIPKGYVGLIFPRSSICKYDLSLSNAVGVIDAGFTGEITAKFKPTLVVIDKGRIGIDEHSHNGVETTDWADEQVTFHGRGANYPDVYEGCEPFQPRMYEVGDRIMQMIILPYPEIEFEETDTLSDTERGTGGYGSTGR